MRRIIFVVFLTFISLTGNGQDNNLSSPNIIPPSPDVAGLMRYVSTPVNHSTGVPEIGVPIFTLKQGSLSVPISISYHAGGIKIRDIASVVGLGWSLNAGGIVGRTIIGQPDENEGQTYSSSSFRSSAEITNAINSSTVAGEVNLADQLNQLERHYSEFQTDRWAYNFNGQSGVFRNVKSAEGNDLFYLIPYKPLRIEKKYDNTSGLPINSRIYYVITDENGTQFEFRPGEFTDGPTTGWNLRKITSADLSDEIEFFYSGSESIFQAISNTTLEAGDSYVMSFTAPDREVNVSYGPRGGYTSYVQRLDSITCKSGIVRFNYLSDRYDGRTTRLTKITVSNKAQILREVSFNQSYFGSSQQHTARMKLDSLSIKDSSGTPIEKYGFVYNTLSNLPGYYYSGSGYQIPQKIEEDYWGYGNGGGGLPSEFLDFLTTGERLVYGGNRNPDYAKMQSYILKEIHFPTGGKTVFEFESNRTDDPYFYGYSTPDANGGIVGGLRVRNIKTYSNNNILSQVKTYTYDKIDVAQRISQSLFKYIRNRYYFYRDQQCKRNGNAEGQIMCPLLGFPVWYGCTSSSCFPLSIMDGNPVIYSQVTEYDGTLEDNNGKTVFYYQVPFTPTLEYQDTQLAPWQIGPHQTDRGNPVALLQKEEKYKRQGNSYRILSKRENLYTLSRQYEFQTGLVIYQDPIFIRSETGAREYEPPIGETYGYYLSSFKYEDTKGYQSVQLLTQTIDSIFTDPFNVVVHKTAYDYGQLKHLQPITKTVTDSKSQVYITKYAYPENYSQSPYLEMAEKNILSPIIEEMVFRNNINTAPLRGKKVDYTFWNNSNNQIYPETVSALNTDIAQFEQRIRYQKYDNKGNILRMSKADGPSTSYVWGYNGQYPIAEVKNASSDEIYYDGFEDRTSGVSGGARTGEKCLAYPYPYGNIINKTMPPGKNYVISYWTKMPNGPWTFSGELPYLNNAHTMTGGPYFDDVRIYPKDAQMTTYTYKPLVGMTSMTDAKGMTTSYGYDGFQRLKTIKDDNGNILKNYEYHYKDQP